MLLSELLLEYVAIPTHEYGCWLTPAGRTYAVEFHGHHEFLADNRELLGVDRSENKLYAFAYENDWVRIVTDYGRRSEITVEGQMGGLKRCWKHLAPTLLKTDIVYVGVVKPGKTLPAHEMRFMLPAQREKMMAFFQGKEPIKEAETRFYYHVAPRSRAKSILANGVEPGHRRQWKNAFGASLGDRGAVYVFSDFSSAVRWAFKMNYDAKIEPVILEIEGPLDVDPDTHIEGQLAGKTWWKTTTPIPPERIHRSIAYDPAMAKELIRNGTVSPP